MKPNILLLISFAAAALPACPTAKAQAPAAAKTVLSKTDLQKVMENTEWLWGEELQVFFYRGGKVIGTGGGSWKFYTVEAPDILKIYTTDPKKDRKAEFTQYRVNVGAMVAEADVLGTTKPGGKSKPMRYVGPAPKK